MAAVEIVAAESVYYSMNSEMIVTMIGDELVESVLVVTNVEVMVFDIDYIDLKQQYHYVVSSRF